MRELILSQAKIRIGQESIPRILKCLSMLTRDQIWYKPNENTNSIGNLILHLEGNATQWILSTFSNYPDHRNRDLEFESDIALDKEILIDKLNMLISSLNKCFDSLSDEQLLDIHKVQCYEETGVGIIIHVIEHFSYHTGQITLLTKLITNRATNYYEGDDLNAIN
jgi:uncharacterized damage-inducible protein DinB